MASDKQQFESALHRWEGLRADKAFSVASPAGNVAIICCADPLLPPIEEDDPDPNDMLERVGFHTEASMLAGRASEAGRKVDLAYDATADDLTEVLQDPLVSDVVLIGHGTLSTLNLPCNDGSNYDWLRVSRETTHLKLGKFVQRQCGNASRTLSVPLGLFAVSDHRNVSAAVGSFFDPESLEDPENDLLQPVSNRRKLSYWQVKKRFPQEKKPAGIRRLDAARHAYVNTMYPPPPSS